MNAKILLIPFFFFIIACSQQDEPIVDQQSLTVKDFEEHLKPEMDYNAIKNTFGDPSDDIGSGIHIYVYKLADSNEVWIGYTDQIIYARLINDGQELIRDLLN